MQKKQLNQKKIYKINKENRCSLMNNLQLKQTTTTKQEATEKNHSALNYILYLYTQNKQKTHIYIMVKGIKIIRNKIIKLR